MERMLGGWTLLTPIASIVLLLLMLIKRAKKAALGVPCVMPSL